MACQGEFRKREGADYETCSFCGSVRFEDVIEAIEKGYSVLPTDKNYKLYVMMPNSAPMENTVISSTNASERPGPEWEPGKDGGWELFRPVGATSRMKFYTDHMTKEQFELFIDLYRGGVTNVAYPGHFYAWGI